MNTTEEIFKIITSKPKWYIGLPTKNGFHNAQSANRIKDRFKKNMLSEKSIINIFSHFGYIKNQTLWHQKKN